MTKPSRKGQLLAALGMADRYETPAPKAEPEKRPMQRNWDGEWTVCQVQGLIDYYGQLPPQAIAGLIGKTRPAVTGLAGKLGLRKKKGPRWTVEDLDYLESFWGAHTVPTLAKRLGRTDKAILLKAKRLGLGPTKANPDYATARELARALKVDMHTVSDYWIGKCGLKGHRRVTRIVQKFWRIRISDFWAWAEHNQDKFDSRRFERGTLGKEPDWMQMKRQRDRHLPARRHQKWTPAEDARLISMFKSGLTQQEIGNRLGRSKSAVGHRLMRIGWENIWQSQTATR